MGRGVTASPSIFRLSLIHIYVYKRQNTTRYAFNAATLKQSTVAWNNSSAGLFVSTDGGKTWGYGWESDDTAVRTAILLEQTLKELDDRYKKATELSEELLKELDERYKTATAISADVYKRQTVKRTTLTTLPASAMRPSFRMTSRNCRRERHRSHGQAVSQRWR